MNILKYSEYIEELSIKANKENNIRKELDHMYNEWKVIEFK